MDEDSSLFSKEGTVARSSQDIVRFFYLERLELMLRAEKNFYNTRPNSSEHPKVIAHWRSCVVSLLALCVPRMNKQELRFKDEYKFSFKKIEKLCKEGANPEDLKTASSLIIEYLENDLRLTDISKVNDFDRTNIILSNREKGYK